MANKKDTYYFDTFVEMVDYSCKTADILNETLKSYDPVNIEARMEEIHAIEHTADQVKHTMMNKLLHEFIAPIEREDIISLAQEIDNVTDKIEDVLMKLFIYNVHEIRPEALEFAEVIVNCCQALKAAMDDFHHFKKSATIHDNLIEINRLEEMGDKLFMKAVRALYVEAGDPITVLSWTETFNNLERCCDACEHVADIIETVIMKNS